LTIIYLKLVKKSTNYSKPQKKLVIASDPALAGERGNLTLEIRDCGACSERSEESLSLLRLRLATVSLLAMTPYLMRLY
jgi:hypothetical protein